MRAAALCGSGFIAKNELYCTKSIEDTVVFSQMLHVVIGAHSVERCHKQINLSRREFKMARKLDRMCGIDDANAR